MNDSPNENANPFATSRLSDVRQLIHRCLDGVAGSDEVARLDRLVASDPAVARELARAATLENSMEVVLRDDLGAGARDQAASPATRPARRVRYLVAATVFAAAAAVLLVSSLRGDRATDRASTELTARDATTPVPGATSQAPGSPAARSAPAPNSAAAPARRLRFADGSFADLRDPASRLETQRATDKAVDLVLLRGAARFEVVHRPGRNFRVWVASAYVEVIGTVFTVERLATGVRVSVERGAVKVVSGANEMRISGGSAEVVPLDVVDAPATERGRPHPAVARSAKGRLARASTAPAPTTKAMADGADAPGALLQASEDARRDGRPQQALSLLQTFLSSYHRDPRAPYVAFMLGRVLLEELARPREAAQAFARVEAQWPRTPLVQDALAREVESWFRAGDTEAARRRAGEFLTRFPDGRRTAEVRRYGRME